MSAVREAEIRPTKKPPMRSPAEWPKQRARRVSAVAAALAEACPLLDLAREAAAVMRLQDALERAGLGDQVLVEALERPDDYLRPSDMKPTLRDRLHAIEALAAHRRAASLKGALFQLYIAACESQNTPGLVVSMPANDEHTLHERDRKVDNLHFAAIAMLEAMAGPDEDLAVLRSRYFPAIYDAHAGCERAIHEREALIADALAAPCTWKEEVARPEAKGAAK